MSEILYNILESTACWGVLVTLGGYGIGLIIQRRTGQAYFNPMLICTVSIIGFLAVTGIPYTEYRSSASPISYLLLPGTVCLAIPLYEQLELLKKNIVAIIAGIFAGTLTSLGSVIALAKILKLSRVQAVTLLPKSVTTAIGMEVSSALGGIAPLSAAIIIMTGMAGHLLAGWLFKILNITDPLAKGVALGTTSHALGTAKAIEMGEVEGAMSGLAIAVAGIMTAILAPIASTFL